MDSWQGSLAQTGFDYFRQWVASKMDIVELREIFKRKKNKNLEIANLRIHIEKKLEQMLRKNVTRSDFAERFRNIIDVYNADGSETDDFYEKILQFMKQLRAEEERHITEELSEEECVNVVGWQNDPQPKEQVRAAIVDCLNDALPDSYDRDTFAAKSNRVYQHIVDQALMGYAWVA